MVSNTPPTDYFTGISFNPDFYQSSSASSSSTTGITQDQADLLYLRKTIADTATVTETFSKIYLTEADTPTPTVNFNLLNSQTANINIGAGQITGSLNIGGSGRTTGPINIGTTSVGATPITIGTSSVGSTTTINGSSVAITSKLTSPVIDSSAATTSMTIGSNLTGANLSIGGIQTGAIGLGGSQTTGTLNLGTGDRTTGGGGGGISIGTAAIGAIPIVIGTTGQSTTSLRGTAVNVVTKITSPVYDSSGIGTSMTVGGNLTTGSITMGGSQTTGDINIGNSNATTDIYIGNGTNNTTGINTGICSINKLQVGNTTTGSGVGTGTPYRCMIIGRAVGLTNATSGTITITGAPTTAGNPIVFASINTASTTDPYFINVNPTGANTFTYYKVFYNKTTGTTVSNAIVGATGEQFNYVAIWL